MRSHTKPNISVVKSPNHVNAQKWSEEFCKKILSNLVFPYLILYEGFTGGALSAGLQKQAPHACGKKVRQDT